MTPDERMLLTGFLNDLAQARAGTKDAEAEALIRNTLSSNPDAAYLLVQHAILSDQALHAAQAQIEQLQAQARPAQQTSFFGGARPGTAVPPTGGFGAPPPQGSYPPQPQYPPQPAPQPQGMWGAPPPQPFSGGGGLGNFLRSAGTMAAGVAAGDFLFSGISGLFGGRGGGFGGGFGGGGFGGAPVENVTINEYGDDNGDTGNWDDGSGGGFDDGGDNSGGF